MHDAFFGVKRFGQFQRRLGIARNILTSRLNRLVVEGVLQRRPVEGGAQPEYVLTAKGLDLQPILLSMTHWGNRYKPNPQGVRLVFVERETGKPVRPMGVVSEDGRSLKPRELTAVPGPGTLGPDQDRHPVG